MRETLITSNTAAVAATNAPSTPAVPEQDIKVMYGTATGNSGLPYRGTPLTRKHHVRSEATLISSTQHRPGPGPSWDAPATPDGAADWYRM